MKWIDDKEYQQWRSKEVCLCCGSAAHLYLSLFTSMLIQTSIQLHITEVKIADLSDAVLKKEDEHGSHVEKRVASVQSHVQKHHIQLMKTLEDQIDKSLI